MVRKRLSSDQTEKRAGNILALFVGPELRGEVMLWVFSQVPISSQLGSGSAVFIPRMISSMTIANRKGWGTLT